MSGVRQIPDDLHSSVPRSVEFLVFFRVQLPQSRPLQSRRVDTKKLDNQPGFIIPKLLKNLMNFIKKYGSLAKNVLLFAGTGSVQKSMEWEEEKSSQISST